MPVSASYAEYLLEQLTGLGKLSSRRMFGAVGLYCDGRFFGLVDDDALFLKVDDHNRGGYLARGMAPFRPFRDRPEFSMSYYQAPVDVIEDSEQLVAWARAAVRAAIESPSKSAARKRKASATGAPRAAKRQRTRGGS
jgi:DNA transformation protein and related proteins